MKSLIKGLSTSLLLVTVSLPTVQAKGNIWCGIVTTEKTPLGIRAIMNQDAEVIASASKGSALAFREVQADWYKVILDDGKTGYARSEFITNVDETEARCGTVETEDTSLNVREGMGINTKVIGKVRKGAMIRLLDSVVEEGTWIRVQMNNGKMGYVNKTFIQVGEPID